MSLATVLGSQYHDGMLAEVRLGSIPNQGRSSGRSAPKFKMDLANMGTITEPFVMADPLVLKLVMEPVWIEAGEDSVAVLMSVPKIANVSALSDLVAIVSVDPTDMIASDHNFIPYWRHHFQCVAEGSNFKRWHNVFGSKLSRLIVITKASGFRRAHVILDHEDVLLPV